MRKINRFFALIALAFLIPALLAWYVFQHPRWLPRNKTHHGHLIQPAININQLAFHMQGKSGHFQQFAGRWLLMYVSPQSCSTACLRICHALVQIHKATGKNQHRVQTILVLLQPPFSHAAELAAKYPSLRVLSVDKNAWQHAIKSLVTHQAALRQGYLYLADSKGNLLMRYTQDVNPSSVWKDLTKLLKVSQIG